MVNHQISIVITEMTNPMINYQFPTGKDSDRKRLISQLQLSCIENNGASYQHHHEPLLNQCGWQQCSLDYNCSN